MPDVGVAVAITLLGVITGGVVALLGQVIADGRREEALRRTLRAELRESIGALAPFVPPGPTSLEPLPRARRFAWDAARTARLSRVSSTLLSPHMPPDEYESFAQLIVTREIDRGQHQLSPRMQAQAVAAKAVPLLRTALETL